MADVATNYGYASAASSVIGSIGGLMASNTNTKAQLSAALTNIASSEKTAKHNIETNKNSYLLRLVSTQEQSQAIDRELGTVLSRRGLDAMKAEGRLRAAGASTGLQGGSIEEIVNQTNYDEILDNQIMISRARKSKADVQRQTIVDWMNFKNQGSAISMNQEAQGIGILGSMSSSSGNSLLAGIGAGMGVGLDYMKAGGTFGSSGSSGFGLNEGGFGAGTSYDVTGEGFE